MMQLLRKDLPWLVVFGVGGAIALALAVVHAGFVEVFVLGPERLEALFWSSGSLGLALGVWSVLWDDLLGTREFLEQRGVSRRRLAAAPIVACLVVLATWAVAVPLLAWVFGAIDEGVFAPTFWAGVPEIWATLAIALPAAACGMFANVLPAGRVLRLLLLAGLVATVGCGLELLGDALTYPAILLLLPLADAGVAALLFAAAVAANRRRFDPDRAWDPATRRLLGTIVLAVLAVASSGTVAVFEADRLRAVQYAYPEFVLHDGQVLLAHRLDSYQTWQPCSEDHVPVGERFGVSGARTLAGWGGRTGWQKLEVEEPRFGRRASREWIANGRQLLVRGSGSAWIRDGWRGGFRATGIGAEMQPLPAGAQLGRLDVFGAGPGVQQVIASDLVGGGIWRFDEASARFTPLPLPDADHLESFRSVRGRDLVREELPEVFRPILETPNERLVYAQGQRGAYAMTADGWSALTLRGKDPEPRSVAEVLGDDALCYTVAVSSTEEHPAARHDYSPRTAEECLLASLAYGASLLRTPVQQLWSFAFAPSDARMSPWNDPLLAGGRRWWLLVLCLGIGAGSAWQMRRFLRRLGADDATIRFWTVAAAMTGIVGCVVGEFCERPRAHARRPVTTPAAPRIVTT